MLLCKPGPRYAWVAVAVADVVGETVPHAFGFGEPTPAMDVTKPFEIIGFGAVCGVWGGEAVLMVRSGF